MGIALAILIALGLIVALVYFVIRLGWRLFRRKSVK
jgi:hypothetical protein